MTAAYIPFDEQVLVPAMVLYEGSGMLKEVKELWRKDQQKEIEMALGELVKEQGFPNSSGDFHRGVSLGIELGLSTARAVLAGSAELISHGADPEKIL